MCCSCRGEGGGCRGGGGGCRGKEGVVEGKEGVVEGEEGVVEGKEGVVEGKEGVVEGKEGVVELVFSLVSGILWRGHVSYCPITKSIILALVSGHVSYCGHSLITYTCTLDVLIEHGHEHAFLWPPLQTAD